jgi:hypothetical protein
LLTSEGSNRGGRRFPVRAGALPVPNPEAGDGIRGRPSGGPPATGPYHGSVFVPGRELCGAFYREAVRPLLEREFPGLPHSAGLFGQGSEVLGYDTERSTDHQWGPRLQLFVREPDGRIERALAAHLPYRFRGWSTSFAPPRPEEPRVRLLEDRREGEVNHRVEVHRPDRYLTGLLGFDPLREVTTEDWLATPSQILLSLETGAVYHDGLDVLTRARSAVSWYPHDLWLHLMACQWRRIAQEEHLVGRAGEVGDDLGSRLLAARLVRDLMRLAFLQERRYAPYAKWFGTAFSELEVAAGLRPALEGALAATDWTAREAALCRAYETAAERHNRLGVTPPLDARVRRFHDRPFQVLSANRFVDACRHAVTDPAVRRLPLLGSIDQFGDCTDLLSDVPAARRVAAATLPA